MIISSILIFFYENRIILFFSLIFESLIFFVILVKRPLQLFAIQRLKLHFLFTINFFQCVFRLHIWNLYFFIFCFLCIFYFLELISIIKRSWIFTCLRLLIWIFPLNERKFIWFFIFSWNLVKSINIFLLFIKF